MGTMGERLLKERVQFQTGMKENGSGNVLKCPTPSE